jgi:hypothetical protein
VQPGRVTVLALTSEGRIQKISYWNPDSEPVAGFLLWPAGRPGGACYLDGG